jgi:chitodextrinase
MKRILITISSILFLFGCSTNNNLVTVVPATPSNLAASVVSSNQVNLSWTDNATNESGYKIQRKTGTGNFADIGSTGADIATFSDIGLTPNTNYTYRVYAYNSAGNSLQYSNEVMITTNNGSIVTIPLAPTNLSGILISQNQVNLTWTDNSSDETGFKIERKIAAGNFVLIDSVASNVTNYSNTGLASSTSYAYRICSYNTAGNSLQYSNEFTIVTANLPTITTTTLTSLTASACISGGNITNSGGSNIIERGVVWDTLPNPTISLSTKTIDGAGVGTYTSNVTVIPNRRNYIRAYATTASGTAYGNEVVYCEMCGIYISNGYFYHPTNPTSINWVKIFEFYDEQTVKTKLPVGQLDPNTWIYYMKKNPDNTLTFSDSIYNPGFSSLALIVFSNLPTTNPGYTPQWPRSSECNNTYDPSTGEYKIKIGYSSSQGYRVSEEIIKRY